MWIIGKTNTDAESSAKTGRFPFLSRRFVHRRVTSAAAGREYRSASSGCSLLMWRTAFRISGVSLPRSR
jgi:hypothetical protein